MPRPPSRSRRPFIHFSLFSIAAAASLALAPLPSVFAQPAETEQAVKDVENSKFSASGIVKSNAVYIRCGPGDNYYPTMKIDQGAKVKVVGAKFDWLKIVPPDGSFCYVARLYVDRRGDGSVGRVNKDSINVRAGSTLSALKIGILCELNQGEDVEILGEEQEYFRIKPPARAYLYINKKFVDPDPDAKPEVQVAKADPPKIDPPKVNDAPKPADPPKTDTPPITSDAGGPKTDAPKTDAPKTDAPKTDAPKIDAPKTDTPAVETRKPEPGKPADNGSPTPDVPKTDTPPADPPKTETPKVDGPKFEIPKVDAPKAQAAPPKTDPLTTPEAVESAFDKAESTFISSRSLPLDEQPLESLLQQFQTVSKSDMLPESMRRIADARLVTIKARFAAQEELRKVRQGQSDLRQRQMALEAEQQELQKRIAESTVKVYAVVGTLQPSSLQQGQGGTLYRVTDPASGRTVCYIRSNDSKTVNLIGQFVGVRGAIQEDARLSAKVINPLEITPCDPGKVHQSITAQIIPPSLLHREPAQATTDPQPQQ
jgi:hypothetical protein